MRADSNGTVVVRKSGLDLTEPGLPRSRSVVLRSTDDERVACGRWQAFELRKKPPR